MHALVVEDNPGWQEILAEILGDLGLSVDVAGDAVTAAERIAAGGYRLAVVDLSLRAEDEGNQEGLAVLRALAANPGCEAILLTGFATVEIAVSALKDHGAYTCLRKEMFRRAEFKEVVNQILARPVPLDPLAALTPRERDVMALLIQGLPNKGIAHELVISENTVKRYLKSIFEKLDVDSRAAAVAKVLGRQQT